MYCLYECLWRHRGVQAALSPTGEGEGAALIRRCIPQPPVLETQWWQRYGGTTRWRQEITLDDREELHVAP